MDRHHTTDGDDRALAAVPLVGLPELSELPTARSEADLRAEAAAGPAAEAAAGPAAEAAALTAHGPANAGLTASARSVGPGAA